jgi:hypothetical protein
MSDLQMIFWLILDIVLLMGIDFLRKEIQYQRELE